MRTSKPLTAGLLLALVLLLCQASPSPAHAQPPEAPDAHGLALAAFLSGLNVENRWLPDSYVSWQSGEPLPLSRTEGRRLGLPYVSHCSDFAAAAALRLGVTLPNAETSPRGRVLLANIQNAWLLSPEAAQHGWERVATPARAQALANRGFLVVASVAGRTEKKPGHIAVVVPSAVSAQSLAEDGPAIAQAGSAQNPKLPRGNSSLTTVRAGFWLHTHGQLTPIAFFAAPVRGPIPAR